MSKNRLFQDFPAVSKDEWKAKITADLKGADYQKKLVWRTDEGFDVQPFYTPEDLEKLSALTEDTRKGPAGVKKDNEWLIRQDLAVDASYEDCNIQLIKMIERGVQSVGLDLQNQKTPDAKELEKLLEGVDTSHTGINFMNAGDPENLYSALVEYLNLPGNKNNTLKGSLGFDPLGQLAKEGEIDPAAFDRLAELVKQSAKVFPRFRIIAVDAGIHQDSGSTLSQELGFGMAMASEYLDQLTKRGLDPATIAASMTFTFSVGPNYFMEIAKLRAARSLWSAIYAEWNAGTDLPSMFIHSRTASWNLTVYDPNVNLLRTTTETMSAILGGSDEITVLPFDKWFEDENEFSSRIARNMQIILKEEAYFSKVADPAAGAYYIEKLTASITDQAWKHFLETEDRKGFLEAFRKGFIQEATRVSAAKKREKAASRRQTILGVNQYPAFAELILNQGRTIPQTGTTKTTTYQPLEQFRISGEIEQLREQTEKGGKPPRVFLLKYGEPAWRTARAMFAGNFFACAGFEIIDNAGFDSVEQGIAAAKKSKPDIVVLCSADDTYASAGPGVFDAMHKTSEVVIAGYPKDAIPDLEEKGITNFIHVKSNLLDELKRFQQIIRR